MRSSERKLAALNLRKINADDRGGMGKDMSIGCVILIIGVTLCMIIAISGVSIVFYGTGQSGVQSVDTDIDFDPGDLSDTDRRPCHWEGAPFQAGYITELTCAAHQKIVAEFEHGIIGGNCDRGWSGSYGDEHGLGQACDYMISDGRPNSEEKKNGDEIATFARDYWEELGVLYIIWYNRIWNPRAYTNDKPELPLESWRDYGKPDQTTQGHFDHPHISFCGPGTPPGNTTARPCP